MLGFGEYETKTSKSKGKYLKTSVPYEVVKALELTSEDMLKWKVIPEKNGYNVIISKK